MAGIKLKRSAVQGKVPVVGDMIVGELAVNTFDGKAFMRGNDGTDFVREVAVKDAQGNLSANSFSDSFQSIASSGGTSTFTSASPGITQVTGTLSHIIKLPDATTLKAGRPFNIFNRSTDVVTVQDNTTAVLNTVQPGSSVTFRVLTIASAAGTWDINTGGGGGSGSGVGEIDYLSLNGIASDGEVNTNGWSAFNTTFTGGIPGAITAGSTLVNVARDILNPLRSKGSLRLNVTTAAGSVGHGIITNAFTIANADLAQMLTAAFDYSFITGAANVDVSGSTTQTVELWVYNVALAQWIQPAGFRGINQKSFVGKLKATFQTDSQVANNSYRLAFIIRNVPTGTFSMNFEGTVGPQVALYGAPVTDWESFTPTGSWTTNTTYTGKRRRVGDVAEYDVFVSLAGAPNNVALTVNLKAGDSIDTSKLTSTVLGAMLDSEGSGLNAGTAYRFFVGMYNSTTSIAVYTMGTTSANFLLTNLTQPGTWQAGDSLRIKFKVPILGWSSSVQMSNDTDTRVVAARYEGYSMSVGASPFTLVFPSKIFDTHSGYNTSNGIHTISVPGKYRTKVSFGAATGSTFTAGSGISISIYQNGTLKNSYNLYFPSAANSITSNIVPFVSGLLDCLAGDAIRAEISGNFAGLSASSSGGYHNHFEIERISGPSAIAASESVNARYTTAAGQSMPTSTDTVINFGTADFDSHGSVTPGAAWKFTAVVQGVYHVNSYINFASSNWSVNSFGVMNIYKNGSLFTQIGKTYVPTLTGQIVQIAGTILIKLNAGDYIYLTGSQNNGDAKTLQPSSIHNYICIAKVGN